MYLLRTRQFALLFVGQALNGIGSWAALVALWGFAAYEFDSGPGEIAIIGLAWSLPAAVIGPIAGVPIDRLGAKRVLVVAYLFGALAAVAMAFAGSFEQLVLLGTAHGLAKAFAQPASDTLPPRLVDDEDLLAANAILGAGSESAIVFGPLVAALAIAAWGLKGAFFVDAATYLVGIAVVVPLRLRTLHERPAERASLRAEVKEGFAIVRADPVLRFTLLLASTVFLTWGAYVVVEPIYVRDVLDQPASFFAALQTAFGVGLVATGLLMPKLGDRVAGPHALSVSVILSGLTAALYVGTRIPAVAIVGVFLWGVDVAFFSAPSRTLLQRNSPPEAHGRVLALYRTVHSVADVAALPLAGLAAGVVGVQVTALTVASFAFVAGVVGYRLAGRGRDPAPAVGSPRPHRLKAGKIRAVPDFSTDLASADDETLRAALEVAEIPALLPALAAATGDDELIPDHLRPNTVGMMDPTAGLGPEQQAEARALAFEALRKLRDQGVDPSVDPVPDEAFLRRLLGYATGGSLDVDDYLDLLREELNIGGDPRTPQWRKDELAPDRPFRVAVIGAGMSGLAAAHRLRQAGLDVVVLEKNHDVGGTWLENVYPGCRVDVSNLFYSYSFAQRNDWPEHFSSQQVLLDYFRAVADTNGLREHIRFDTEVTSVDFDDTAKTWRLQTVDKTGREEAIDANAVVSAVGQLNRPSLPDIPGVERFEGPAFHSARWDHSVDLAGKRVAVIGTGASAAQFIPVIAEQTADLTVFQRTPAWFIPAPNYTDEIGPEVRWLRRNVPGYTHWNRFWVFWRSVEGMMPMATVDPDWDGGERSVSAGNDFMRQMLTGYLQAQFGAQPELLEQVVPQYAPFSKRFILDNGAWATTLQRDDVHLVTDRIAEVTENGVRTVDGTLHEADVIIYGTGFKASDFLMPMKVVGRNGTDLHEHWAGDARAYLGIVLPGFPNFFMLYGPNTNIVVNGSIIYFSECEVHYVVGCIRKLLETGAAAIDPKPDVHDAYNERIDAENLKMAWGVSSVSTWYKNATGRTAQNWPFSLLEYWQQTREPDLADYEVLR